MNYCNLNSLKYDEELNKLERIGGTFNSLNLKHQENISKFLNDSLNEKNKLREERDDKNFKFDQKKLHLGYSNKDKRFYAQCEIINKVIILLNLCGKIEYEKITHSYERHVYSIRIK